MERRHREATALALKTGTQFRAAELEWIDCGGGSVAPSWERVSQALAAAEQSAYERGLANRDERCLQSDTQRIRERLAAERAWDEGYANGLSDAQTSTMYPRATNPYRLPKGSTK